MMRSTNTRSRRSFMQSMLALGMAPWVMSNGVAGGVLMPVRRMMVPSQDVLRLYAGTPELGGVLLAEIPLDYFGVGTGSVVATGVAARAEIGDGTEPYVWMGVGDQHSDHTFRMLSPDLCAGQSVHVNINGWNCWGRSVR